MIEIFGMKQLNDFIWDNQEKVTVIYFSADWCGPCKKLKNILEKDETKLKMPELAIGYIDIDNPKNKKLVDNYKIESIPVQIFVSIKQKSEDEAEIIELHRIIGYDMIQFEMKYNDIINN